MKSFVDTWLSRYETLKHLKWLMKNTEQKYLETKDEQYKIQLTRSFIMVNKHYDELRNKLFGILNYIL